MRIPELQTSQLTTKALYVALTLLGVQVLVLIVATMVRYNKYGSIGLYARKVLWPKSYKIKLALQCVLLSIIIAQFILCFFTDQRYILRYLQLVVQLVVWTTSLAMYRFEYKRALGHIWYMHPLVWAYTAIYYLVSLVLHFYNPVG